MGRIFLRSHLKSAFSVNFTPKIVMGSIIRYFSFACQQYIETGVPSNQLVNHVFFPPRTRIISAILITCVSISVSQLTVTDVIITVSIHNFGGSQPLLRLSLVPQTNLLIYQWLHSSEIDALL